LNQIQIINFADAIWTWKEPDPVLLEALNGKDTLIEISTGTPPHTVVLGVPHHASVGVEKIAEKWWNKNRNRFGRDSDEGAALYALAAYTVLRDQSVPCKLVIFAHSTDHDPNKNTNSSYFDSIFGQESHLLFECHGAGESKNHDLELSAGQNNLANPLVFGRILTKCLDFRYKLAAQIEPGRNDGIVFESDGGEREVELQLPGLQTISLEEAGKRNIPALHIEAKPNFRKPTDGTNTLTQDGLILGRAIAKAIIQYHETEIQE
jgi:hypothetical protein